MALEITGRWEEIMDRSELRGHQVKVILMDESGPPRLDSRLEAWRDTGRGGQWPEYPVEDCLECVYPETA